VPPSKKGRKTNLRSSSQSTGRSPIDQKAAQRVYGFFEGVLRHSKGQHAGKPFTLLPWQKHVLGELFGRINPDGTRKHRIGYIELPKKQGKSTTLAGVALYMLLADGEPGAEVYGAAADREQAGIIYREASSMVRSSPALSKHLEVIDSRKTIVHKASNSFYRVLSADAFRAEGSTFTPCCLTSCTPSGIAGCGTRCGTAVRQGGSRCCCRSPRPATTGRASAGSNTPTQSGASPILR
jgi:phage terminase large subunit-like protein